MLRAFLLCFGLLALNVLWAQDAEVVVTATKEPTDIQTVPVDVTVLGQDVLQNSLDIADALSKTLAVRLSSLSPGAPSLTAKGYGENGFGRVGYLLDGVTQNNPDMSAVPLNLVPLFAVDRIEILDGPGSALYGNGTSGGVVNVVTRIPDQFQAEVKTSVDQRLGNTQELGLGIPIGLGGLLISTSHEQAYPERDRSQWYDWNAWSKYSVVLSGTKEQPNQTAEIWGSFHNQGTELPGGLSQTEFNANPNQADNPADGDVYSETRGGAAWSLKGDGWKLTTPVSVLYREDQGTLSSFSSFSRTQTVSLAGEPRWNSEFDDFPGGTFTFGTGLGGGFDRLAIVRFADDSFTTQNITAWVQRIDGSLWISAQQNWNDRVYLTANARYEVSQTAADSPEEPAVKGEKWYFPLSGDLGVTWLPARPVKLGLQLSQIFRYPFFDEQVIYYGYPSSPDHFFSNIDAELGHSLAGSADWNFQVVKWTVGTSATRMENEVWIDPVTGDNQNSGPTYHLTADSSLVFPLKIKDDPLSRIEGNLGASYSIEKAWYASGAYLGNTVPLVPDSRFSATSEVTFYHRVSLDFQWNYIGSYYTDEDAANALPEVSASQSLDFGITWKITDGSPTESGIPIPEISLRFWGKNLTDDRTPTFAYGTSSWYPTEGRTVGLLAKAEW